MSKFKLFPRKDCAARSCEFTINAGEAALLSAFDIPCGYCVSVNKVEGNRCRCEHFEKEHCQLGYSTGVDECVTESAIVMPGKYVAILTYAGCPEEEDVDRDWAVYVQVGNMHDNLQTLSQYDCL